MVFNNLWLIFACDSQRMQNSFPQASAVNIFYTRNVFCGLRWWKLFNLIKYAAKEKKRILCRYSCEQLNRFEEHSKNSNNFHSILNEVDVATFFQNKKFNELICTSGNHKRVYSASKRCTMHTQNSLVIRCMRSKSSRILVTAFIGNF